MAPDRAENPIHLTIHRRGDVNIVDLAEVGALIPRSEVHVSDGFLAELAGEMQRLGAAAQRAPLREGASGNLHRDLERVGGLIFSHLLSEPARRRLRAATPRDLYLRLDERLVHVPWELCHDGDSFLSTKFRVGRQVITGQPIPETRDPVRESGRLRVLLVADPTELLPRAAAESEELCALLDRIPGIETTLLAGSSVRRIPLLATLQDHDVVHFAGHSHYDAAAPAQSGWRLADGVLTAGEIARLAYPPRLVFSNSCEAGASAQWDDTLQAKTREEEARAFGIGSAFLLAGVRNYVGTFWVVRDDESVEFALACYQALAAGETLGTALLEARREVISERHRGGLAWASYVLYGDPAYVPLRSHVAAETRAGASSPSASSSAEPRPPVGTRYRYSVEIATDQASHEARAVSVVRTASTRVVGRERELARLEDSLELALRGERQLVLVSGPAGIGKTSVVDELVRRVAERGEIWVGHGQSVEQYGAGEPYLPVLEALTRLAGATEIRTALRRHAPTWLAQIPGLATASSEVPTSRERMLREMADLVGAATRTRPLVLVLEDLHWADQSTFELLSYLAERREEARLLLVGTHRPTEALPPEHPLRAVTGELRARGRSRDLRLDVLGPEAVGEFLNERFPRARVAEKVAQAVHRRTEGHPLFLVNVVDDLHRRRILVEEYDELRLADICSGPSSEDTNVPESLRQVIGRQADVLSDHERRLLQAASVAGQDFSVAELVAALEVDPDETEEHLERMAGREQFVRAEGVEEWPDGTLSGRYGFIHALYRDAFYEQVAQARRVRMHARIGRRKEAAYGERAGEIAGALAAHFDAGRDVRRALHHHSRAADNAIHRFADREAADHLRRCLALSSSLDDPNERRFVELITLTRLTGPLMATQGFAAREVEDLFARTRALCREIEPGPHLHPVLRGAVSFHQVRGEHVVARQLGEELLGLVEGTNDVVAQVQAHYGHGVTLFDLVELESSQSHLERAIGLYEPAQHDMHVSLYGGYDPGAACLSWLGWVQWHRGYSDRAFTTCQAGIDLAEHLAHPLTLDWALLAKAIVLAYAGVYEPSLDLARRANRLAAEHGFVFQQSSGMMIEGWARLGFGQFDEALALIQRGLDSAARTGARISRGGYQALLAVIHGFKGDVPEAMRAVAKGLEEVAATSERLHLIELTRARGDLLWRGVHAPDEEVEQCYRSALELADRLAARSSGLRAALSLARFLAENGRGDEGAAELRKAIAALPEGRSTQDFREAEGFLARFHGAA